MELILSSLPALEVSEFSVGAWSRGFLVIIINTWPVRSASLVDIKTLYTGS